MSMTGDIEPQQEKILFLNYNQDFSCVSVGTEKGYRMYNCDPFGKCYSKCKVHYKLFPFSFDCI